jgi:hypothetical protein
MQTRTPTPLALNQALYLDPMDAESKKSSVKTDETKRSKHQSKKNTDLVVDERNNGKERSSLVVPGTKANNQHNTTIPRSFKMSQRLFLLSLDLDQASYMDPLALNQALHLDPMDTESKKSSVKTEKTKRSKHHSKKNTDLVVDERNKERSSLVVPGTKAKNKKWIKKSKHCSGVIIVPDYEDPFILDEKDQFNDSFGTERTFLLNDCYLPDDCYFSDITDDDEPMK